MLCYPVFSDRLREHRLEGLHRIQSVECVCELKSADRFGFFSEAVLLYHPLCISEY